VVARLHGNFSGGEIDIWCTSRTNVRIGENTVIAAQTGISGSAVIGRDVAFGGQAGLGDHCLIERWRGDWRGKPVSCRGK